MAAISAFETQSYRSISASHLNGKKEGYFILHDEDNRGSATMLNSRTSNSEAGESLQKRIADLLQGDSYYRKRPMVKGQAD